MVNGYKIKYIYIHILYKHAELSSLPWQSVSMETTAPHHFEVSSVTYILLHRHCFSVSLNYLTSPKIKPQRQCLALKPPTSCF